MSKSYSNNAAFEAMNELLAMRERGIFSDVEFFKAVAESGPLFRVEVENLTTAGTSGFRHVYKPSESVDVFLSAVKARDGVLKNPS